MMKRKSPIFLLALSFVFAGCERANTISENTQPVAIPTPAPVEAPSAPAGAEIKPNAATESELALLPGPNAVPADTRIVVNAPAFRMDLFRNGSLIKSYKIGIGYPRFPLPTGLRKAQTIIFNPTWTPPNSPWVADMENITAGKTVAAGSKSNPLGPIKVPIGMPSLIHGGKAPAKIGRFASHGCIGLTNTQAKDFARRLIQLSDTDMTETTIATYERNRDRTRPVKLKNIVPVELRYETIVVEDGQLHIYRDAYNQNTNTEENLRAVLASNGVALDELTEDERAQALEAVNTMSRHPKRRATDKPSNANRTAITSKAVDTTPRTAGDDGSRKPVTTQREITVELSILRGKGYPAPVELDGGNREINSATRLGTMQ